MKKPLSVFLTVSFLSVVAFAQPTEPAPGPGVTPDSLKKPGLDEPVGAIVPSEKTLDLNAPPASEPAKEESKKESSKSNPHLIGLHAGVGAPFLLGYGVDYVPPMNNFSFSLDFGGLSHSQTDVKLGLSHIDAVARYHVFGGSFFLGLRVGQQKIKAEATETKVYNGFTLSPKATLEVKTSYMTPHIGWQANSGGFFISTDFGAQVPSSNSTDLTVDYGGANAATITVIEADADFRKAKQDAIDAGDKVGKTTLPFWTMIRIGYYF